MAWYCISFGLIARYHTVMYRCNSARANYREVHLVIFDYKHTRYDQSNVTVEMTQPLWETMFEDLDDLNTTALWADPAV